MWACSQLTVRTSGSGFRCCFFQKLPLPEAFLKLLACALFREWETLRAELHHAFELLFDKDASLPRSLSEIQIESTGVPRPAIHFIPAGEREARGVPVSGEELSNPELVFGLLNPHVAPSAFPRQRVLAEKAFLSVAEE